MESWVNDLKYILMPSGQPLKGYEEEYDITYKVWRQAWEKYRSEIGVTQKLNSDGFLLPDEMGVLFYKGECVGFAAFKHGMMGGPLEDLGWFNGWNKEAIDDLKNISMHAIVCSQFTINPRFAGKNQIVRWKDIVSLYSLMRFESSDAGVMAGQLNLIRGMQNACGDNSGVATVLNPEHYFDYCGQRLPVQLVAYERHKIHDMKIQKGIVGLCEDLWSKLIHLTDFPVKNNIFPFKHVA